MEQQIPIIYFLGISPGRYQPIIPTFIVGWYPDRLRVQLAFGAAVGASVEAVVPAAPERRYALRQIKARLHQASGSTAILLLLGSPFVEGSRFLPGEIEVKALTVNFSPWAVVSDRAPCWTNCQDGFISIEKAPVVI
jgi:hypothetical protein